VHVLALREDGGEVDVLAVGFGPAARLRNGQIQRYIYSQIYRYVYSIDRYIDTQRDRYGDVFFRLSGLTRGRVR